MTLDEKIQKLCGQLALSDGRVESKELIADLESALLMRIEELREHLAAVRFLASVLDGCKHSGGDEAKDEPLSKSANAGS